MARLAQFVFVSMALALSGCGDSQPTPPANDPDSVRKLEELQKKASQGEK